MVRIKIITEFSKRFITKRKYPLSPDQGNDLPIKQYGFSKKSYQRVYVWGNFQTGALGVAYLKNKESLDKRKFFQYPKRLSFAEKCEVTTAGCGFGFSAFAINSDTNVKLYGTGLNTDSQIGYHAIRKDHPMEIIFYPQPLPLPFRDPINTKIVKIVGGRAHLAVLTDEEGVFLLGNNSYGQCGRKIIDDENYAMSNYINHIKKIDGKTIIDIECGQDHTLALTDDGSVYSCGWGADGQTGLGHFDNCSHFTKVCGDIENEKITKVTSRSDFVLAINNEGKVFGWGNAEYGQINVGNDIQQVCKPTFMQMIEPLGKIKDVAAGGSMCLVLNERGEIFVWGFGILGTGPQIQQSNTPLKLPSTLFGKNDFQPNNFVKKIKCGLSHSVAITNLGDIYTWGRNNKCCLGLRNEDDQFFPLKVSLSGYANDVFCGIDHTIAICKPYI